jgi:hypothetical protein
MIKRRRYFVWDSLRLLQTERLSWVDFEAWKKKRRKISDAEFGEKKREYEMAFMNKEHLFFYEIYKEVVGEVPKQMGKANVCPLCKAELPENRFHCYICGFLYPISKYVGDTTTEE